MPFLLQRLAASARWRLREFTCCFVTRSELDERSAQRIFLEKFRYRSAIEFEFIAEVRLEGDGKILEVSGSRF